MARVAPVPGVLVVDKPRGPTSHDVVARVRRALKTREVGHAGTLDPMATGVLVVAIGEATKLVPYLTQAAKVYEARLVLGTETDTLDALGQVVTEQAIDDELLALLAGPVHPLPARLADAVRAELERSLQDPPIYSAIQQDGERAYARARRGEEVVLDARPVHVHELTMTAMGTDPAPWVDLRVKADKGYYVRSLGRDLARAMGTVGHLGALRRLDSGGFDIAEAISLDASPADLAAHVIPLRVAATRALPGVTLSEHGVSEARFGRRVALTEFATPPSPTSPSVWLDAAGAVVAVGSVEEETGRVLRGFAAPAQ